MLTGRWGGRDARQVSLSLYWDGRANKLILSLGHYFLWAQFCGAAIKAAIETSLWLTSFCSYLLCYFIFRTSGFFFLFFYDQGRPCFVAISFSFFLVFFSLLDIYFLRPRTCSEVKLRTYDRAAGVASVLISVILASELVVERTHYPGAQQGR